VVVIGLCTLACRIDRGSKADVVSWALFGDGAAAVLRAGPSDAKVRIGAAAEHTWPRTLDIMGWMIDPVGFRVILSRSLPRFVEQKLAAPVRRFIKAAQLQAPQLICHPGGAKVLDAIEVALELQQGTLRAEREILRGYGNMSAPTVLFVLERMLQRACAVRRCSRHWGRGSPQTCSRSRLCMREGAWLLAFVLTQRLVELCFAHFNASRLRAEGGIEFGAAHYSLVVAMHASWLLGLWLLGSDWPINAFWLVVFAFLQVGRVWVIASLGRRWTTRVIVLRGAPRVTRGPYHWFKHPNYLIVALEIAVVPLALRLPVFALVFSIANAALLAYRIRIENEALAWAAQRPAALLASATLANR